MTQQRQRTTSQQVGQTANQVHPEYASAENADGVTFANGNMLVNRGFQVPVEAQRWESSNGITVYTAVKWRDPQTGEHRVSCNCNGWAMKKAGRPRRCKHTDDMMGIKTCSAKRVEATYQITTIKQAEEIVPRFEGRALRGIMLD